MLDHLVREAPRTGGPLGSGMRSAIGHREVRSPAAPAQSLRRAGIARAHRAGLALAVVGWAALMLMWATGSAELFGHDQDGVPAILGVGLFLVGWGVMIAAMMVPSTVPTMRRLDLAVAWRPAPLAAGRFLAGYLAVWTAFGTAAFAGDAVLHALSSAAPWLGSRPWLIGGGMAIFAGTSELIGRTPPPALPVSAGPTTPAFHVGKAHGVDRIRRCWPLMLFAMATGMTSPVWMIALTLVMLVELHPKASWALRLIGSTLVGLGIAIVVHPAWEPILLGTG